MSTPLLRETLEYAAIGEAIQRAARDLPEGYNIDISVEHHGGGVTLTLPNGNEDDYPSNHETLSESIADALEYAQEHAKQNAQVTP
jgi:hypothetical protein